MNESPSQSDSSPPDLAGGFAMRPPSQAWEPVALPDAPQQFVWAWFKPAAAPQSLVVTLPDELWRTSPQIQPLTLRKLLHAAGVDPGLLAMWQIYGMAYHGLNGTNPALDQPIPPPAAGAVAEITFYVTVPQWNFAPQMTAPPAAASPTGTSGNRDELLERLEIEWSAVLDIEKDLDRLRKMLVDLSSRMKVLNRDLNSDERLYSSREDKQDWQDARRFLRDSENRLRACVKEFDIGDPSSAGYRRGLEQVYLQYILPKVPFSGMEMTLSNFEAHRKLVMTLQGKMNSVYLGAVQNGERRAQQVLQRIAGKVREGQSRKTTLGVLLDG